MSRRWCNDKNEGAIPDSISGSPKAARLLALNVEQQIYRIPALPDKTNEGKLCSCFSSKCFFIHSIMFLGGHIVPAEMWCTFKIFLTLHTCIFHQLKTQLIQQSCAAGTLHVHDKQTKGSSPRKIVALNPAMKFSLTARLCGFDSAPLPPRISLLPPMYFHHLAADNRIM